MNKTYSNFKIKLLTPVNLFKNFKFRYETISSNFSQEGKFSTSGLCSKMILFCMLLLSTVVFSQAIGDYRSNVTTNPGSWTTVANWQRYNGTTWPTATVAQGYPGQYTSTANVTIVTGDIVELNASVQIASLTTVGTGQLRDSGVDGYTLKISGNIVLAAGLATPAAEVGPINMKIGTGGVNTIEMNGTAQQTISGTPANGPFFYNLDISNTSTAGVVLQTNVFVASNLNVASGSTYDLGTYTSNKNSSPAGNSTFTLAANAKLRLSGSTGGVSGSNFPNRAGGNTLTWSINSASTVEYYGTTQTVAMNYTNSSLTTADIDYGNLTISGTGTKTLGYDGLVAPTGVTVAGALTVNANNTLALSTYTLGSPTSTILYGGATTGSAITGTGQLTLGGNVTVNDATTGTSGATISCPVALGATRTFTVADDGTTATDLTISGVISGATFGVIKAGVGTMTLSGTNTYTGATTISAGTVKIGASSSVLGTTAGITSVTSGAVLDLNGFTLSTAEPLTLNGIGLASSPAGALTNTGGNASYSGAITLASASTITATSSGTLTSSGAVTGAYVLTLDGGTGSTGTMSGVISTPTSVIKNGAGTWILSGTNTYTGPTNITAGTLKIGASSSVLGTTAGITTVSSGAVLDINGFNLSTAEPLTLNGTGLTASPAGALTNTGGNASYSGAITLASASTITATTSGTLTCSGTVGTGAFGLTLDGATGSSGTMSGVISSPTSLTKNGAGTWTFSAANTYTGITTINAGVLQLGNNNVIAASPINLNGGTFRTGATTGYTDTVGTLTVSSASTIALGTGVHQINFATSSGVTWPSGNLTITGWTGVARASGTAGKVFVGAASGTLTAGQLAKIFFTGYTCSAMQLSTGEVVPSDNTVGAASSSPAACVSVAISPVVTHTTAGATGIANDGVSGANGLPAGVSATWATNTITISGTPTASGSFPYSILLTGGCGTVSATGTITVTALPVANAGADNCSIATGSFSITTGTPAGGTWIKVSGTGNISTGGNVTGFGNNSSAIFRYTVTNSCGSASDDVYYARGTNTVGTPTAITVIGTEPSCQLTNATTTTTYSTTATNSSSFNWSLSNPSAGSINSSGVMTWANGFSGTVNIQVTATSCSGTSSQVTRTVTISAAPAITVQPSTPAATCSGSGTQTMTVTATGAGLTYDWKLAGVSVVNGGVISGQGTVTLTLTNPTSANAGSYTVVVSGTCAPAVTSTARTVTVNALPSTPTLGTITQPTCVLSTGSVILSGLPGSGTINQTGTAAASYAITGTTMTISGLAVGSYTFSASNGTCSSLATGSVVISSAVTKTWNGTAWSPVGTPTKDNLVIINGNYSASSNGDLNACSLIINSGFKLTIESGKFVIIQNDLTVTGTLDVLDKGSLVMVNDAGVVTNTGTT
ncbi:MAG: autotransporter-associated beta strand repeat-containing protein, partial [Bacteroidota bacterium]